MPASVQNPKPGREPCSRPGPRPDAPPGSWDAVTTFPDALNVLGATDALIALHAAFSGWSISHTPEGPVPWVAQRIRGTGWTGGSARWEAATPGGLAAALTDAARLDAQAEERAEERADAQDGEQR